MFGFGRQLTTFCAQPNLAPLATPIKLGNKWHVPEIPVWRSKPVNEILQGDQTITPKEQSRSNPQNDHSPPSSLSFLEPSVREDKFPIPALSSLSFYANENEYCVIDLDLVGVDTLHSLSDSSADYLIVTNLNNVSDMSLSEFFAQSYRVLRAGGEVCFSGQFSTLRVASVRDSNGFQLTPLYIQDLRRVMNMNGFVTHQTLKSDELSFDRSDPSLSPYLRLSHRILNAFKIDSLEDCAEDYGQLATYDGGIGGHPSVFALDVTNYFPANVPVKVSGNTAEILSHFRHAPHFEVSQRSQHRGPFTGD